MTYKELLNIVTFEEVEPHIMAMYPESKDSLGWFKLHYDMLKLMIPKRHVDANGDVCNITMKVCEDDKSPYLYAFNMEGDWWEHSLTKEIVLDTNVHATNAEIAACCLWHSSFYAFTEGDMKEWSHVDYKSKAKDFKTIIFGNGGYVPSKRELLPSKKEEMIGKTKKNICYGNKHTNKIKRKCLFRQEFMEIYYERMEVIGNFIVRVLSALSLEANRLTIGQLCKLYYSCIFASNTIQSYADETTDAANYMTNLISKYEMLPHAANAIICLTTGHGWGKTPMLNLQEEKLIEAIVDKVITTEKNKGKVDLILDSNPALGHQIEIAVVATDICVSE